MVKFTFIYGPKASGKSYKARELSSLTGARVLDDFGNLEDTIIVLPAGSTVDFIDTGVEK